VRPGWDERVRRAEALGQQYPFAAEALRFYARLAGFQRRLEEALRGLVQPSRETHHPYPLQGTSPSEHRSVLIRHFPGFLEMVQEVGPRQLAVAAEALRADPPDRWEALWEAYWRGELRSREGTVAFFPKAYLQPYAALLAAALRGDGGQEGSLVGGHAETSGLCPLCGAPPQVSVLREEGHGATRSLVCSRCETEWRYQRVRCVSCGQEQFDRLVYLSAEDWPHVRVSACQECRAYVKEVDLSKDGLAVPVVDDLATIPLDLVAVEEGYRKVELNLIGL
jgi:formate dehydrogenase accessory protein FdhE